MEDITKLIHAIASVAWPLIVVFIIILFSGGIRQVLESAKGRKFTLKVAGNELTMDEVSEQQRALITDLQKQIIEVQKRLEMSVLAPTKGAVKQIENALPIVRSILWVDDNPRNNAYTIASLSEQGIQVDTALSTSEGLAKFGARRYDRIISDMARTESGQYNRTAGLDLVRQIRAIDKDIPIVIYSSVRSNQEYRKEALAAGANEMTSSTTVLLNALKLRPDASAT
jgi:CheY-like chemotaxis protein